MSRALNATLVPAVLALALAGCATVPPEEDPVQIRLNDLDQRLARIERVVTNQSLLELSKRIDALQNEVRALRGQVEELDNSTGGVRRQQRDLYADLDRRLAALEAGPGGAAAALAAGAGSIGAGSIGAGSTTAPPPGGGTAVAPATQPAAQPAGSGDAAQALYARAFDALRAGNYALASTSFRDFLARHPTHDLADNAQYWLGEAYYVNRDYANALAAFERVVQNWPESSKAPDALLKVGYTQIELKRVDAARQTLTQVTQRYPGTEAARLAQGRLAQLR